jgi:hypothetical protein
MQSRIERPLLHPENVFRDLLNALSDGPTVDGLEGNCSENQEVESTLQKIGLFIQLSSSLDVRQQSIGPLLSNVKGKGAVLRRSSGHPSALPYFCV